MRFWLGIESTAHTFGVSIVSEDGEILADERDVYVPPAGGLQPREVARHHTNVAPSVLKRAFQRTGIAPSRVSAVGVSYGPGLGPCLRVGVSVARALSSYYGWKLFGVNHTVGHVELSRLLSGFSDPLAVYVSGGNTNIVAWKDGRYRIFGETLDIAVGNLFDSFAREVGLQHPGGPKIEKLAREGKKLGLVELPYSVKGQDVSFSGLLTAAVKAYKRGERLERVAYSLQEIAFSMLAEAAERALVHTRKDSMISAGGVAANSRLNEMLSLVAAEHSIPFFATPVKMAGDNGIMIAAVTMEMDLGGVEPSDPLKLLPTPKLRMNDTDVYWRITGMRLRLRGDEQPGVSKRGIAYSKGSRG
ncbi:MAG: KEOPS complex N(6)-L-threonylcarbamoyladenine synthase Kae1 [Thermoprotei archaeon]